MNLFCQASQEMFEKSSFKRNYYDQGAIHDYL